jgi:uncharacterized protein (DUF1800 family)
MTAAATVAAIRFGYGLPPPVGAPAEPAAMLAALAAPDVMAKRYPGVTTEAALALAVQVQAAQKAARDLDDAARKASRKETVEAANALAAGAARAAVARALASPDGLRERLVQFWTDHFTVARRGLPYVALPSAMVEDAIRPNLTAPFAVMLAAVTTHPAMLLYLNQDKSVGPGSLAGRRRQRGLNENLAREVLELHTLGVGAGYSQTDVRQLAELMTGLSFTPEEGFAFQPRWAEPGAETVLGRPYGDAGRAELEPVIEALEDLAVRPETAQHLARKLAVHFLADDPDPAAVAAMARAWAESGGDLGEVTAALVSHAAAWAPTGAKVRQPFDYVVTGLRALGLTGESVVAMRDAAFRRHVLTPMAAMGQPWQQPRGPDGWPEAAADWITPQGLAARLRWSMATPEQLVDPLPDPRAFVERALADAASPELVVASGRAETRRDGVGLILASPDFNRR